MGKVAFLPKRGLRPRFLLIATDNVRQMVGPQLKQPPVSLRGECAPLESNALSGTRCPIAPSSASTQWMRKIRAALSQITSDSGG